MLASVSASAVDGAVLLTGAGVGHVTLLAPAEETLAPLTGDNPVVDPRRLVPTDFAGDHFNLCWKRRRAGVSPGAFGASYLLYLGGDLGTWCCPHFPPPLQLADYLLQDGRRNEWQISLSKVSAEVVFVSGGGWELYQFYGGRESSCREATCSTLQDEKL